MNLVFIGASKFGLRCLSACLKIPSLHVVGVITAPQKFSISYRPTGVNNVLFADVASFADEHTIPVRILDRSMNDQSLLDSVTSWKPDVFLVVGWYHMIPKRWRELAPAYGLHASMLPDYSGGAPLVWAMINGESKTGITLFQMDDGVDSGPIAGQKEERIAPDDTIGELYARIEERGLELLSDALPKLACGNLELRSQDEEKRRIVPQRSPEDGMIDWSTSATFIDRFIRAQTKPYPGAFSSLAGKPLHIWSAEVSTIQAKLMPGVVIRLNDNSYHVACGDKAILIREVSYEQRFYRESQLAQLFGLGGQSLGVSM